MRGLRWYWNRLRVMDASEIWGRVTTAVRQRKEALIPVEPPLIRLTGGGEMATSALDPSMAPEGLRESLRQDAQDIVSGRWLLFGWKDWITPMPPDWHQDPLHGVKVPYQPRLNHRRLPGSADARSVWEISRWAEPVRLAMHAKLNQDPAALEAAISLLRDWVTHNPTEQGINWTSSLEAGLRLINFGWLHELHPDLYQDLVESIVPPHVWSIGRHLSHGSSANNHRLGELTGLLVAVKRWPELEPLSGSAERLWQEISQCVLHQFAEDGGNKEQALHYHLFAFEMGIHAARAMQVFDGPVVDTLRLAARFFTQMGDASGEWDYGDNDDAQIVPFYTSRRHAAREWHAWLSGHAGCHALQYWLGDWADAADLTKLCRQSNEAAWVLTSDSGMASLSQQGWKLRLDASPLGFGNLAAHGHGDALHLSIWDQGTPLVIDPGTGGYFGAEVLRAKLATWEWHNGPQPLEGFKTPEREGLFLWRNHHSVPHTQVLDENEIRAEFRHEGHFLVRAVSPVEDNGWVINDRIHTEGYLRVHWILGPDCVPKRVHDHEWIITHGQKNWSVVLQGQGLQVEQSQVTTSPKYGQEIQCWRLAVSASQELFTTWRRTV